MEIKFKAGDRVRAIVTSTEPDSYKKGYIGTVVEDGSWIPYVQWDSPNVRGVRGYKRRAVDRVRCIPQHNAVLFEPTVTWTRPKADNNIVNNAVRVLAKVYTYVSNVAVKAFKCLRGNK